MQGRRPSRLLVQETPWWTFMAGAGVMGILSGYGTAFAGQIGLFHDNGLVPLFGIGAAGTIILASATVGLALRLMLRHSAHVRIERDE